MEKEQNILCSIRNFFNFDLNDLISKNNFGAILSRAGVGKTSFLVQIALYAMLNNMKVLHISLTDPVEKISLWYKEVFTLIAQQNNAKDADILFESLLNSRFIMTFKIDSFNVPMLTERLTDLLEHNIFSPDIIIIDGLNFDNAIQETLLELKNFIEKQPANVWFAVRTHRHKDPGPGIIPAPVSDVADFFNIIMQLRPENKKINVVTLKKDFGNNDYSKLQMDPVSMLLNINHSN